MASSFESNHTTNGNLTISMYEINRTVQFCLFVIFDIFAILCSIFTLYHLLTKPILRKSLYNHTLILMLFFCLLYELIDIPLHLQFFYNGFISPAIPELCLIWWFIDWGFYYLIEILLLFTAIERHILIFHSQIIATRRKRLLVHYLPIAFIVLFMLIFYSIAIFAPICENAIDYTADLCGFHACYISVPFFFLTEQIGFSMMSSCFIFIFNISLLIRVIRQQHRVRHCIQWRKQRKLAIQVILMSLLFWVFSLPITIIYLVRLFDQSNWGVKVFSLYFFVSYFPIFFLPVACLPSLPKLWDKLKNLRPHRPRQIAPA